MKKLAIAGALMLLAGCAEVENYNNVVKTPAPDWLAGYWQTKVVIQKPYCLATPYGERG